MKQTEPRSAIISHCDGACIGNPGPGGWAAAIRFYDDEGRVLNEITLTGGVELSTNNKMEMTAAIEALKATPEGAHVEIVSDSRYVVDGM
ncbi:MAG: RNase H family protein, partial [Pararhizobium sp.]